ncbi:glycosyl transferase family 2 [Paracoccus tegillarcae]|uniref:Glycosyl transferase family 2 n=2 Tax=Paracoccus tegillarcae TaxID=1529068 RepID=A0A2K9ECQ2_9RHOB|nr:glycosyl transferase family 2 [Paracoccus tegillarcae]
MQVVRDATSGIGAGDVLCFATIHNEALRLPDFLRHYRKLGVDHFLLVVHDSDDGTLDLLEDQSDVSVWVSHGSYRDTRFGMDWMGWLLGRYGHGHWCLTVDADEFLIYPHWPHQDLHSLTSRLDEIGQPALGALMVDLYPKGSIGQPLPDGAVLPDALDWFDAGPYRMQVQQPKLNRWVQGGVRARTFFADRPDQAPTLNKLPLIKWNRRFAYANSTHSALPRRLNLSYDGPGDPRLTGVLLHTKFTPDIVQRSIEEKRRRQHFNRPDDYTAYYDALIAAPDLWHEGSVQLRDWRQLVELELMSDGGWHPAAGHAAEKT